MELSDHVLGHEVQVGWQAVGTSAYPGVRQDGSVGVTEPGRERWESYLSWACLPAGRSEDRCGGRRAGPIARWKTRSRRRGSRRASPGAPPPTSRARFTPLERIWIAAAGLKIIEEATVTKERDFDEWTARVETPATVKADLERFILAAPARHREALRVKSEQGRLLTFSDRYLLVRALKPSSL